MKTAFLKIEQKPAITQKMQLVIETRKKKNVFSASFKRITRQFLINLKRHLRSKALHKENNDSEFHQKSSSMAIIIILILHWYASLFFQTVFLHRYASHAMFQMSRFWEKIFFICTWVAQGTSYLNPFAYAYMHRMHHKYTEKEEDPHSPDHSRNIFSFMMKTYRYYSAVKNREMDIDKNLSKHIPQWFSFEKISESLFSRLIWGAIYISLYFIFAPNHWWFLLLPIHFLMGPIHGAIINWFSHKIGYKNYTLDNNSTNLFPIEILMGGEALHNNHHARPFSANFASKWFELDPSYLALRVLDWLKVIQLNRASG